MWGLVWYRKTRIGPSQLRFWYCPASVSIAGIPNSDIEAAPFCAVDGNFKIGEMVVRIDLFLSGFF